MSYKIYPYSEESKKYLKLYNRSKNNNVDKEYKLPPIITFERSKESMVDYIRKRDGQVVKFDKDKIVNAIIPAMKEANSIDYASAIKIANDIASRDEEILDVETIQDLVEEGLMKENYPLTAKRYIIYREERTKIREKKSNLMKYIKEKITASNNQNSNANVDERSFGARKNEAAGVLTAQLAIDELLDPDVKKAWEENLLYIHDRTEYAVGMHNCLNVRLAKLLQEGFTTRNGDVRPANSFSTACQLVAVVFQAQSQGMFGGVGANHIDDDLAPFVRISFLKHFKDGLKYVDRNKDRSYEEFHKRYKNHIGLASIGAYANIFKDYSPLAYEYAIDMLEKEGLQSTQALYHNLNTLESRPGSQLPFSSINFGLNTTFEGRKVTEWLLKASLEGIGKYHRISIFPISIFQYKTDINDRPGTPNYDLFKLAVKSTVHTIYPNYCNADWISNEPDVHPTYLISVPSISKSSMVHILTQNKENTKQEEYIWYNIEHLYEELSDKYEVKSKDGYDYIDLRFVDKNYFVNDEKSVYKEYMVDICDTVAKISYISASKDKTKFSITTDTFRHDYLEGTKPKTYKSEHFDYAYNPGTEMATMGSCDGSATIKVKIDGKEDYTNFTNLWNDYSETHKIFTNGKKAQYIDTRDLKIYDSSVHKFVYVKRIIRNEDIGLWYKIKFIIYDRYGKNKGEVKYANLVHLTADHPLPVLKPGSGLRRTYVKNLKPGDKILRSENGSHPDIKYATIESIERIGYRDAYGYDVETDSDHFDVSGINSHNCRTLIGKDRHGCGWDKSGRGNVCPHTMNLAKLGIKHGICLGERKEADIQGFWKELDELLKLTEKSLLDRYKFICSQNPIAAYFMYDNGTIVDSENSIKAGNVEPSMRHNTLAIGFIGLANMLYAMFGKYHNQDKEVLKFGIDVVKHIYDFSKEASERNDLNFSCYMTPAENLCHTWMKKLKKEYGNIKGVTDHDYLTNSCHVPVFEKISIKDKIDIESNFSWMGTGGNITYTEYDAEVMNNCEAIENIIHYAMKENNHRIAYFAINFPIDTCNDCGFKGVIDDKCPKCGAESSHIQRLRRVTGYLTADYKTRFNPGKRKEVEEREKHSRYSNLEKF